MGVKEYAIRLFTEGLANLLVDDRLWDEAKKMVQDFWDADLSGEEKAERVKNHLAAIGNITGKWLLNILNELAYIYVKALKGEL